MDGLCCSLERNNLFDFNLRLGEGTRKKKYSYNHLFHFICILNMKMITRPVTITAPPKEPSTAAKRTLFRVALTVAMGGSVAVSTILFLQGGLALGQLRYFIDIGLHPLHVTSALLLVFGLLPISTFIILTLGLIKVNRKFALIAAGLLAACSFGLITFSIWSFVTISSGQLPSSINNTLIKELDQTQYKVSGGNIIIENTNTMAKLEKQHQCCGLINPIEDYQVRQPSFFGGAPSNSGGNNRGRTTTTQRNLAIYGSSIPLPISCCNEKYRSVDNSCIDISGKNIDPSDRYNLEGCYAIITREKFQRIQQQGFTTIIAACLAVISCIALAAVLRLLAEGYQVVPLRLTT
jgi:hypothetical protein